MYQEEYEYIEFCSKQNLDKELHTLEGIVKGIAIDGKVSVDEVNALLAWCEKHRNFHNRSPFNEIVPFIKNMVDDSIIDEEEKEDLLWLCNRYITPNVFYNRITADMQRLQGVLAGIVADGKIDEDEINGLQRWLESHEHLRSYWPFDEIDSLITEIMSDGVIDEKEHKLLVSFCSQFLNDNTGMILDIANEEEFMFSGVCSAMPDLTFSQKLFCLSGTFENGKKNDIAKEIQTFGGEVKKHVVKDLDYLVVGGKGNTCWAFSCYGRKVEQAMANRKLGCSVQIVHEFDLWDSLEDLK